MRNVYFLFLLLLSSLAVAQDKPLIYQQQTWISYNPQVKFSRHWGLWFDSELHTSEHYFNGFSQATFRLGGTYFTNKLNKITAGYGYTDYFPGENHAYISLPEHFAWQQYQWYRLINKNRLMQWVRIEEKWKRDVSDNYTLADTYTFIYRVRYQINYQVPLSKEGIVARSLALAMNNELYLYYGPHTQNHIFDQDRVFVGLSYALNANNSVLLGVLNILQEELSGQFKYNNVLRLSFSQNIGRIRHLE